MVQEKSNSTYEMEVKNMNMNKETEEANMEIPRSLRAILTDLKYSEGVDCQ